MYHCNTHSDKYADIMYLPKPKLKRKMERAHRAKIFAPFDALKGFKESVTETADLSETRWNYETEKVVIC
ncbi:MAG: hypothetical protein MJ097_00070 [Dorea sp.]|nr:hypothetical protein [Dorea sp.]